MWVQILIGSNIYVNQTHTPTHTHTHTDTYIYIYIYVYTCVCVWLCVFDIQVEFFDVHINHVICPVILGSLSKWRFFSCRLEKIGEKRQVGILSNIRGFRNGTANGALPQQHYSARKKPFLITKFWLEMPVFKDISCPTQGLWRPLEFKLTWSSCCDMRRKKFVKTKFFNFFKD